MLCVVFPIKRANSYGRSNHRNVAGGVISRVLGLTFSCAVPEEPAPPLPPPPRIQPSVKRMGCAFSVREYLHSAPTSAREAATRLFGATPRGRGSSSVSRVSAMGFLTDSQLEDTMRKFEQFDKDRSGYIEQNELDGLKSLFSMKELDVGVEDGRISRAEFVAGLHRLPYELAKSQVDGHMDKLALAQRLQVEVQPIMEKFDAFDKVCARVSACACGVRFLCFPLLSLFFPRNDAHPRPCLFPFPPLQRGCAP